MNSATQKITLQGGAGVIEALLDLPADAPCGTAVIAHPHPLFGGTMTNKVVQTLARAFVQTGWRAVRFNFRGVGASAAFTMKAVVRPPTCWKSFGRWRPKGRWPWLVSRSVPS